MEFRILGPVEVWEGGKRLPINGQKQLLLLAVLLLNANQSVSVDRLVDELWPVQPPADPDESVQALVYQIRKIVERDLPRGSVLERQGRGYRFRTDHDELDLHRFEWLVRSAREARSGGELDAVSWTLSEALALWRGPALGNLDLDAPTSTRAQAARLDELRLTTLIERIEIDLELELEDDVVAELEALVAEHRLDERARELQMLALYRSGRQAEALQAFQDARSCLVDELGIEPGKRLQVLQQAILRQDPALDSQGASSVPDAGLPNSSVGAARSLVAVAFREAEIDQLLPLAEGLARSQLARELILVTIAANSNEALKRATSLVKERRDGLLERGVETRAAAFTSASPARDVAQLASRESVDLLLMAAPDDVSRDGSIPNTTIEVLEQAPCDVALLVGRDRLCLDREVLVPFGGNEHDWAALELGAWAASAADVPLALVGVRETSDQGESRDASRVLAGASLAVQQTLHVAADIRLAESGEPEEFLRACDGAALLVVGLPEGWRKDAELGPLRLCLAQRASAPVLFVRRGERPGGLAPRESVTTFSWSLIPAV